MQLHQLGWTSDRAEDFAPHAAAGLAPARIATEHRGAYVLLGEQGEFRALATGRLRHEAEGGGELRPVVGDWVAATVPTAETPATIQKVLQRRTKLSRQTPGPGGATVEQVLAANIDAVFLVMALDGDFNLRRLERFLTVTRKGGATPIVILSKVDLCPDVAAHVAAVEPIATGVPIHPICATSGEGVDELQTYFADHRTVATLGSSGVGKSTLINRLSGNELLRTQTTRDDGRGRHTTSHRELVLLPESGMIVDTPGLRELQLWEGDDAMSETFADLADLARDCRFSDCRHVSEPGCAVRGAIVAGRLDPARLASHQKLRRELEHLERKLDKRAQSEQRKKWRAVQREARARARAPRR